MDNTGKAAPQLFTFDRVVRMIITALCIGALILLIDYLSGVLLPFLVACVLAYMLDPLVQFNRKIFHLKGRALACVLTLVECVLVIGVSLQLLIPYISSEMEEMIAAINAYNKGGSSIPFVPAKVHDFIRQHIDFNFLSGMLTKDQWINLATETINRSWEFMGATANVVFGILSWVIVLLYLVFILLDYDNLGHSFRHSIPNQYRTGVLRVIEDVKKSANHYFRGQALIALIVGILFSIGFTIVGVPLGIVLGMLIGLLNIVPYLQVVSIPICLLLCLFGSAANGGNFWELFGGSVIVYFVVQAIQDLYLTPRIMGKYMGLKPAVILLALSVWGFLLGFIGLIIALPLTTLVIAYYKEFVLHANDTDAEAIEAPADEKTDEKA